MLIIVIFGIFEYAGINDTIKNNPSFFKRFGYSIGYSCGICYTGEDLRPYGNWMEGIYSVPLYILHSIEGSVIIPMKDKKGIEIGIGYGWTHSIDGGFEFFFYDNDSVRFELAWCPDRLGKYYVTLMPFKFLGVELLLSKASGTEHLLNAQNYPFQFIDSSMISRYGIGAGLFGKIEFQMNSKLYIFLSFKIGKSFEFYNSSPRKDLWANHRNEFGKIEKLEADFSGIYLGIMFKNLGGQNEK